MSSGQLAVYAIGAAVALVVSAILTPMTIAFARRRGWLDRPNGRKAHAGPTPDLAGVAIFVAFWVAVVAGFLLPSGPLSEFESSAFPIFLGAVIVFLTGAIDDRRPLSMWTKLTIQIAVACFLWVFGLHHPYLWIPFYGRVALGMFSLPVTILWFVAVVNCVNLIDGLDWLAGATSMTALVSIVAVGIHLGLGDLVFLAVALLGALVPFMWYNRPPARTFMGDSGSLTLGYFFAVIALWAPIKRFTALAVFVPLIALLVPLGESAVTFIRRLLRSEPIARSDRDHIHHRLLDAGWKPGTVVALAVGVTAAFATFTVVFQFADRKFWAAVLGIFVLALGVSIGMLYSRRPGG